jgi:hypothetical protein
MTVWQVPSYKSSSTGSPQKPRLSVLNTATCRLGLDLVTALGWGLLSWRLKWLSLRSLRNSRLSKPRTLRYTIHTLTVDYTLYATSTYSRPSLIRIPLLRNRANPKYKASWPTIKFECKGHAGSAWVLQRSAKTLIGSYVVCSLNMHGR